MPGTAAMPDPCAEVVEQAAEAMRGAEPTMASVGAQGVDAVLAVDAMRSWRRMVDAMATPQVVGTAYEHEGIAGPAIGMPADWLGLESMGGTADDNAAMSGAPDTGPNASPIASKHVRNKMPAHL